MSTTIDSLDIQISTSAGKSAAVIQEIATALGSLKANGKITVATNGLKRLADALTVLNPALNALNPAKLQQLRGAMAGLSNLQKASGLSSAVNTLKKIPDVINGLDTAGLDRFEQQMKRLGDSLAPLAIQIDKIGTGFSKLPNHVSKAVTVTNRLTKETERAAAATKKHSNALDKQSINLMSAIYNFQATIGVVQMVGDAISNTLAQAMEWDGIQYRFGRAFGEDAEEVYAYAQKINDVLGINMQQFMQYSSLYGSLLSGFGMAQDKVTTISVGLTELSYDIWAAYNDRFKSLEDASEAVRSAITGEIEPIRNAGIALTEASLQEYLDSVGMATVSIEKLSEAQKAEIRYAAMMNAALNQGIVGTYAKEMQTAEGAVRNLSQAWKGLVQAFGSLFIPILQAVIPYVTALVELLREAVAALADFLGIAFFEIDWKNTGLQDAATGAGDIESGLEGAAEAAKKIQDYTMGFDELNIIQPPTESGAGSGGSEGDSGWGSGLDLETLWDESVFANASKKVGELKEKIKDMLPVIGTVTAAFGAWKLTTLLTDLDDAVKKIKNMSPTIKGIGTTLAIAAITVTVGKLVWDFTGAYLEGGSEADLLKAIGTTALGTALAALLAGKKGSALVLTTSGVITLTKLALEIKDGNIELTDPEALLTGFTGILETVIGAVFAWSVVGPAIKAAWGKMVAAVSTWLASSGATTAMASIGAGLAAIPVWGWIAMAVVGLVASAVALALADYDFTDIGRKIGEALGKGAKAVVDFAKDIGQPIIDGLNAAFDWCKENITWENVKGFLGAVFEKETWTDVIWPKVKEVGQAVWDGIWEGIEDAAKNLWGNITEFVDGFVQGFKDGFEINSPSKKMIEIGEEILAGLIQPLIPTAIRDKVKEMWEKTRTWWNSKPPLAAVSTTVSSIKDKLSTAWDTARTWWNKNKPTLSSVTATVASIKEKLVTGWVAARTWWSEKKSALATVHAKIASIKEKLSSAWTTARTWWSKRPSLSTVSVSVGSIKDKLVSAWNTAKNWFAKQSLKLNIKMPHLEVSWNYNIPSWQATIADYLFDKRALPYIDVRWYAKGGMPSMGEMFIAREAGPEMVGKIGSRNAVVNNDQIVAAVSEGVYAAVVAAMKASAAQGGNGQAVNVYLDGKQLTSSVEKHQRERGASLMGNQVFSY